MASKCFKCGSTKEDCGHRYGTATSPTWTPERVRQEFVSSDQDEGYLDPYKIAAALEERERDVMYWKDEYASAQCMIADRNDENARLRKRVEELEEGAKVDSALLGDMAGVVLSSSAAKDAEIELLQGRLDLKTDERRRDLAEIERLRCELDDTKQPCGHHSDSARSATGIQRDWQEGCADWCDDCTKLDQAERERDELRAAYEECDADRLKIQENIVNLRQRAERAERGEQAWIAIANDMLVNLMEALPYLEYEGDEREFAAKVRAEIQRLTGLVGRARETVRHARDGCHSSMRDIHAQWLRDAEGVGGESD